LVEGYAWIAGRGTTGEVLKVQALCNTGESVASGTLLWAWCIV
jgi:hypothetical protein